jgi:hypothetical protein
VIDDQLTLKQNDTIIPLQAIRQDLYIGLAEGDTASVSVGFPSSTDSEAYIYVNSFVHKRAELSTTPDPGRWKSYEGTYTPEGLDMYTIRIAEDELRIYSKNDNSEITLTPIDATRFGSKWGIFEFLSENGSVFAVKQGPTWIFRKV